MLANPAVQPGEVAGHPHRERRVQRGAKPAEMAVDQASRFELAVNLRTARAIGLTIPQSLVIRADRVIE